ncbi:MAG: amidohydrolase, partial [Syntrophaceae bacterium]|nr:amidohydrolase [Syntrophaceae bacterium]
MIDFHVHAFPDSLAPRAMSALTDHGGADPCSDGTIADLERILERSGVDYGVLLSIATNGSQMRNVNDFAISQNGGGRVIAFGSVYPFAAGALEELDRIAGAGLKGIKLHPDYQDFFVDDERLFPLYEKVSELGLILVFHA